MDGASETTTGGPLGVAGTGGRALSLPFPAVSLREGADDAIDEGLPDGVLEEGEILGNVEGDEDASFADSI